MTKKDLKPVELQAEKIKDKLTNVRAELTLLTMTEEKLKEENEKIRTRVVLFGVISIVVMLGSTYMQVTYLRNFFRNKKII